MIHVTINDDADELLTSVWMREAPQIGSLLWLQGKAGDRLRQKGAKGTSAFRVTDVAHWVSEEWTPNSHVGEPIHTVCVYVDPVMPAAEGAK